ncbi:MAG: S41 family peptidase [Bacteroidota bacterium]
MKYLALLSIIIIAFCAPIHAQQMLHKTAILEDLNFLDERLQSMSSYQGLNGYDYQADFDAYSTSWSSDSISKTAFGLFLTETIGKIGDRHAYARNYDLPDEKFMPFAIAPFGNKVVALQYDKDRQQFEYLHTDYPYLRAIDGVQIETLLAQICPKDIGAPQLAYHSRAVERLRDLGRAYAILGKAVPEVSSFTFSGEKGDTSIRLPIADRATRKGIWMDKFEYFDCQRSEMNEPSAIAQYFQLDAQNIAYLRIPHMARLTNAPNFYQAIHQFMASVQHSKALILDVRGNGGGSRGLILELAKYLVAPDAIQVVNVAQQRSDHPLNEDQQADLNHRFLFALEDLEERERQQAQTFLVDFQPIYNLPKSRFSTPHFMLLNGEQLRATGDYYHYEQPVFILANEGTFSAASILVSTLKNLPNVKIVGVTTDGSSGNSEKFYLPHSDIKIKLSTMVSFQTNGKPLDGFGTTPDIEIQRNIDQVFWKNDHQLESLKRMILAEQ